MYFDLGALQSFHLYWRQKTEEDLLGTQRDLAILQDNDWLQDSAVIDRIGEYKGQWEVSLVFADPARRSTFVIRPIRTCPTYKNAVVTAGYMRRVAAKDPRGTIQVDANSYPLHLN